MIERCDVKWAKPEPDLFLAWQAKLGIPAGECYVVGDAAQTCSQLGAPIC